MTKERTSQQIAAATAGWSVGGSFFGSVVSGLLLGLLVDWWLDTEPWAVVVGITLGMYSGFMRLWHYAKAQGEIDEKARRER